MRQLVLLLAAVPNPTHVPVCISPLLLTEFESTAVVSKRQEDQQVPVWPVPRPRPRRVRGGPVAAREGRLHHPSQKVDRSAGSDCECGGLSSSQEDLYIFMCSLL